jgi:hypothetical protein
MGHLGEPKVSEPGVGGNGIIGEDGVGFGTKWLGEGNFEPDGCGRGVDGSG